MNFLITILSAITVVTAPTTAYSEIDSCHYANCVMANGERAHIGAAACPRKYDLGTKIAIDDKMYTCKDRTAKRVDGRFDLFQGYGTSSYKKAIEYGIKQKQVYIINK